MQRHENILLSLKRLDYLSRSHIQRLHDLKGDRNARRVLADMKEWLSSFRGETAESIYYLSKAGRDRVGATIARQKIGQANHYLMRADAFIKYGSPADWRNEIKITVPDVVRVIPDAMFTQGGRKHFVEIDHLQAMSKNAEKIQKYRKLKETGALQDKYLQFPRLLWVTMTEGRRKQLTDLSKGLDVTIHLWADLI
jgi:hypothetical protein